MSDYREKKVARLLSEGRVKPEPSSGLTLFTIEGDSEVYRTVVGPTFCACTCQHWRERLGRCTHIDAAVEMVNADTEKRKPWLAALARRVAADRDQGLALIDSLQQ